jgi:hypothetical protein
VDVDVVSLSEIPHEILSKLKTTSYCLLGMSCFVSMGTGLFGYGPGSTVARHGAAQHVVRSITSRFELIL